MSVHYKHLLEIFFPPSEDELLLRRRGSADIKFTHLIRHEDTIALLPYSKPAVKAAIHLAKFHHHREAQQLLASVLIEYLESLRLTPVIIPVPLSSQRERERGYNQVTEILKVGRKQQPTLFHLRPRLLKRTKHTAPQSSLTRTERLQNLNDVFTARSDERITPETPLLIVDDVTTTGTTLRAAASALRAHYPHHPIVCLALAH